MTLLLTWNINSARVCTFDTQPITAFSVPTVQRCGSILSVVPAATNVTIRSTPSTSSSLTLSDDAVEGTAEFATPFPGGDAVEDTRTTDSNLRPGGDPCPFVL